MAASLKKRRGNVKEPIETLSKKEKRPKQNVSVTKPSARDLLRWYDRERRQMPWRAAAGQKPNPYHVWLSEIMLQQTTVATVIPYFEKFVKKWPTLSSLAGTSLDDVLRMWAGLGYYRRARMLHACAQALLKKHEGSFPQQEKELLALPGFGPYTAAAVAAIAFGKSTNVVDGNVERVISRIFAIKDPLPGAKSKLRSAAKTLVPRARGGDYAQALMDLGATVCMPRSPKCSLCPWQGSCQARMAGIQETLPQRAKKKTKPVRRTMAFVLYNSQGKVLLRRRTDEGLLASMMEVPSTPWVCGPMPELADARAHAPLPARWRPVVGIVSHVFTHFTLEASIVVGTIGEQGQTEYWANPHNLENEALPTVMKKIVRHAMLAVR